MDCVIIFCTLVEFVCGHILARSLYFSGSNYLFVVILERSLYFSVNKFVLFPLQGCGVKVTVTNGSIYEGILSSISKEVCFRFCGRDHIMNFFL